MQKADEDMTTLRVLGFSSSGKCLCFFSFFFFNLKSLFNAKFLVFFAAFTLISPLPSISFVFILFVFSPLLSSLPYIFVKMPVVSIPLYCLNPSLAVVLHYPNLYTGVTIYLPSSKKPNPEDFLSGGGGDIAAV